MCGMPLLSIVAMRSIFWDLAKSLSDIASDPYPQDEKDTHGGEPVFPLAVSHPLGLKEHQIIFMPGFFILFLIIALIRMGVALSARYDREPGPRRMGLKFFISCMRPFTTDIAASLSPQTKMSESRTSFVSISFFSDMVWNADTRFDAFFMCFLTRSNADGLFSLNEMSSKPASVFVRGTMGDITMQPSLITGRIWEQMDSMFS